ncbi:cysteine hydrolase family protein [Klebsiella oxytoca]|uniref:cysteine hydrolase family protein n=1 Tax=Klebsiella oxytoca TaxID=571 RepID=UPI000CFFB777|nr:isochorismatase family cysteine hydrolase [Klebsiella oxytoca]AVL79292.1 cysteine hydrolase [Klebsiella oxytoca]EKX5084698.1 cysteine hydrolase [Klebsiella oxytoca]EKX5096933.1 cysteine hydrolase [Klebsiella oxytoca]ELQ8987493.1 cysteine hydrolase [Klebsiella oxytoca]NDR44236.1 cysteine hydrolase [Klebsiella oxytoca]
MTTQLNNISKNSALLVMDFQEIILNNYLSKESAEGVLRNTASLISGARAVGVPVIYISVGFRKGYPEVSKNNTVFSTVKEYGIFINGSDGAAIHTDVAPTDDEPVIIKHRVGAFTFTDLEMVLRSQGIETLILTGITTSGVVLSTIRQAFDLDYRLVVAKDCCADPDDDSHLLLLDKIFTQHACVVLSSEIKKAWMEAQSK